MKAINGCRPLTTISLVMCVLLPGVVMVENSVDQAAVDDLLEVAVGVAGVLDGVRVGDIEVFTGRPVVTEVDRRCGVIVVVTKGIGVVTTSGSVGKSKNGAINTVCVMLAEHN